MGDRSAHKVVRKCKRKATQPKGDTIVKVDRGPRELGGSESHDGLDANAIFSAKAVSGTLLDQLSPLSCCSRRNIGSEYAQTLGLEQKFFPKPRCSVDPDELHSHRSVSSGNGYNILQVTPSSSGEESLTPYLASSGQLDSLLTNEDGVASPTDLELADDYPRPSKDSTPPVHDDSTLFLDHDTGNIASSNTLLYQDDLLNEVLIRRTRGGLKNNTIYTTSGGKLIGLGVQAFSDEFDKHFDIDSAKLAAIFETGDFALDAEGVTHSDTRVSMGRRMSRASTGRRMSRASTGRHSGATNSRGFDANASLQTLEAKRSRALTNGFKTMGDIARWRELFEVQKKDPASWCVPVRFVLKLWGYIANDLQQYAASHCRDDDFHHICLSPVCQWHHAEEPFLYDVEHKVHPLKSDMHLVVQRYIKPWTEPFDDTGMALLYKAGHVSLHRQVAVEETSSPSVFISHCWNEKFKTFVKTLKACFDPDTQVWICSFALWQHGDVAAQLGSLEGCPFAVALASSKRVLLLTDKSIEAITRCWCVLEATLSMKFGKPYDVCLEEKMSEDTWNKVINTVEMVDLNHCFSTNQSDKDAILSYAKVSAGGIDALNTVVRHAFRKASENVKLLHAASRGDLPVLEKAAMEDLREVRDTRGRGIVHVAAIDGQVSSIMYMTQHLGKCMLDMCDNAGMTPLGVAAHVGATAGVQGLLALEADLEGASSAEGLTPLHYAALGGSTKSVLMLVKKRANVEAQCRYRSSFGRRPLHLAAIEGHAEVTRLLMEHRADNNAHAGQGATVLWQAVHAGHTDVVAALLAVKVDANLRNTDKFSRVPLMQAVKHDSVALVSVLIGASADVNVQDGNSLTCLDYCTRNGTQDAEFIRVLVEKERRRNMRERARCRACHACVLS